MAESIAENYFREYSGPNAFTVLQSLVTANPKEFENSWRDFKTGQLKGDFLIQKWGKAISAFANAGGGVTVFGIVANKDSKTEVDAATKIELVPNMDVLKTDLLKHSAYATDPPLSEIDIRCIPATLGAPDGFVVCYVPEGKHKPYQQIKPHKRIYYRINADSVEADMPILRQLFAPQRATKAQVEIIYSKEVRANSTVAVFELLLTNVGVTSITECAVGIDAHTLAYEFGNHTFESPRVTPTQETLHPGMHLHWSFAVNDVRRHKMPFTISLYQEDQAMKSNSYEFDFIHGRFIYEEKLYYKSIKLAF